MHRDGICWKSRFVWGCVFAGNPVWRDPGGAGKAHPGTQSGAGRREPLLQPHVHMWETLQHASDTCFQLHTDTSKTTPAALACAASMMEATNHEVELGGAEPEIIELLVEFVYTARSDTTSLHRRITRVLHAFRAHACLILLQNLSEQ